MFSNKILLISGGTGSFGNAVLRRFVESDLREIRILSRDEKKQDDMRKRYNNPKLKLYIGDVRDYRSVLNAVRGADFIFHAAALKQVPSCEFHPMEAVKTNVLGTDNILEAAINCEVTRVVCLSTDKAVYPINAMGISKAMMEKGGYCQIKVGIADRDLRNALRKRNGLPRFGYSAFCQPDSFRPAHHYYGPEYDPLYDDAR